MNYNINQEVTWMLVMPSQTLNSYIDICLIDEYATKDQDSFHLHIDEIPQPELANYLDRLMTDDEAFKEMVTDYMQAKIEERLPECESKYREDHGLTMTRTDNGDYLILRKTL